MRIISEKRLKEAWEKHPDAERALRGWIKLAKSQDWNSFVELKNISLFAPDAFKKLVIFDIGGNKYRLITYVDYARKKIYIRDFLTHAEYDKDEWKNDEWIDT
jgi:mRNA interferase HigB